MTSKNGFGAGICWSPAEHPRYAPETHFAGSRSALISAKKPMSSQESRKDPRSKILNLTVRYKSATVAEFVEDYSYDISRGGLFIKTNSPFPNGTLLKFEVRIGEEQTVIDGVGRVTWRRERNLGPGKPAGMGIKFIRIADECVQVIQNAVDKHADQGGQFEDGAREQGLSLSEPPANLRSSAGANEDSEPAPVPRMFPKASQSAPGSELDDPSDQSMLFQSTELLKAAMSKVAPGETHDEHPHVEDRATLPTGASRVPPAASSSASASKAVPSKVEPVAAAEPSKSEQEPASVDAPEDDEPDSSEEVTKEFVPSAHGLVMGIPGQGSRSKPPSSARRKNPKKKKKKFNYTSLPAPKHSKPPAAADSESSAVTAPPRPMSDLPPPTSAKSGVPPWLVALGLVAVLGGLFLFINGRKRDAKPPASSPQVTAQPAVTPVVTQAEPAVTPEPPPTAAALETAVAPSSSAMTAPEPSAMAASATTTASEPAAAEPAADEAAAGKAPEEPARGVEPAEEKPAVESAASRAARIRAARRRAKKAAEEEAAAVEPAVPPAAQPSTQPAAPTGGLPPASPASAPAEAVSPNPTPAPSPAPGPAPAPAPTPQPTPPAPAPPAPIPPAPAPPAPVPPPPAPPSPAPPTPAQ